MDEDRNQPQYCLSQRSGSVDFFLNQTKKIKDKETNQAIGSVTLKHLIWLSVQSSTLSESCSTVCKLENSYITWCCLYTGVYSVDENVILKEAFL